MCGFLGSYSEKKNLNFDLNVDALDLINHRGPDTEGFWVDKEDGIFLGFKRLKIIDLSPLGDQPMVSSNEEFIIVFNGEIYNFLEIKKILISKGYKFISTSDTEVLLYSYQEWKEKLLDKLEGMFSFAIFDKKNRSFFLARDRSGEKPLYYYQDNQYFIFSSEIKPIAKLLEDYNLNVHSINVLFQRGYVDKDSSALLGIKKVKPGNALEYSLDQKTLKIFDYWINEIKQSRNHKKYIHSNEFYEQKLESLLFESVEKRMVADVPIGFMLSGGLDSSLIAAIASKIHKNINTFTVTFNEFKNHDESYHALNISNHLGTNHNELVADKIEPEIINTLVNYFDDPMVDSSMIPTFYLCKEMSKLCKVAIGGDGADELFGGYKHYLRYIELFKLSRYIPIEVRRIIYSFYKKLEKFNLRGRKTFEIFSKDISKLTFDEANLFGNDSRSEILQKSYFLKLNSKNYYSTDDFINNITFKDYRNYLSEDILVKVDRASMASSLELRSPYLDSKIINFAFNELPSSLKINKGERKLILANVAKKFLPDNYNFNRKQGFSFPINELLQEGSWYNFFYNKISNFNHDIFNTNKLLKILDNQKKGFLNGEKLFAIVLFICWYEQFFEKKY